MRTHIDCRTRGDERIMVVTLRGTDDDYISLIDAGSHLTGEVGNLIAAIAQMSGLVDVPADDRAQVVRLMRRVVEIMERPA